MKTSGLLLIPLLTFAGCMSNPGAPRQPAPIGVADVVVPLLTGAAGAAIGEKTIGGARGAAIGGGAGVLAGAVGTYGVRRWHQSEIDEKGEEKARAERVKVETDYWESHAINGGNGPNQGTEGAGPKATKVITYPPGVYEGVLYGPREVEVPAGANGE